jgi:hypothetical protein
MAEAEVAKIVKYVSLCSLCSLVLGLASVLGLRTASLQFLCPHSQQS